MHSYDIDTDLPRRRLPGTRVWLLAGILLLLALTLGLRDTHAAEQTTHLSPIVSQHNRLIQPTLTVRPGAAIRMPHLATAKAPILGRTNAIQQPTLATAKAPILGRTNAIQQPTLAVARTPILGSSNAIQQPTLAVARTPILGRTNAIQQPPLTLRSLQVQVRAVRLPILGSAIVPPRLDSTFGMETSPPVVLPTTGSGIVEGSMLPNLLVLLLAGAAMVAFGLAIRVQHRIVDSSGQRQPHRPHLSEIHPSHPLLRYGGDPPV